MSRETNSSRVLHRCIDLQHFLGELPLPFASIRVTQACNLNCIHCYAKASNPVKNELRTHELFEILDELTSLGGLGVRFTGGEPFLRNDMTDLVDYAYSCDLLTYINTNGMLITKEILNRLKRSRIKLFQISLDGPTQEINDVIRGEGSFEKATHSVQLVSSSLKNVDVAVGTVIFRKNYHAIPRILDLSVQLGAKTCSFMFMLLAGRAAEIRNQNITLREKLKVMAILLQKYRKFMGKINLSLAIPPALFPEEFRWKGPVLRNEYCSFPYLISIMANGDVYPCEGLSGISEFFAGNVRRKPLKQIWQISKILKKIRSIDADDLKGVCRKCKLRNACIGGCRAAAYLRYGDLHMPDPLCQELYEANLFPKNCVG